jgi:hypothetical protein
VRRFTSRGHTEHIERDAAGARTSTILDDGHDARDALGRESMRALPWGGRIHQTYDPVERVDGVFRCDREGRLTDVVNELGEQHLRRGLLPAAGAAERDGGRARVLAGGDGAAGREWAHPREAAAGVPWFAATLLGTVGRAG